MLASRTLIKEIASVQLVFGMDWFAILDENVLREVRRLARQHKATHAVYGRDGSACAGLAILSRRQRGVVLYSAAQLVAQRFVTGAVALVLPLEEGQWWLVAVHDGAVIARTDAICASVDEAHSIIASLRQAYPGLVVLDDQVSGMTYRDLASDLFAQAVLKRIRGAGTVHAATWRVAVLALILVVLLYRVLDDAGWGTRGTASAGSSRDHQRAWEDAIQAAHFSRWVHDVAGTSQVIHVLLELPVHLAGWRMQQAVCNADMQRWRCQVDYGREDTQASNRSFLEAAPENWKVEFVPLNLARGFWEFDARGVSFEHAMLGTPHHTEQEIFSELQGIRPAFSRIVIDTSQVLPVSAPVDDQGRPLPQPAGLPHFYARALLLEAPLRSLSLLLPHSQAMFWQKVTLRLDSQVRPDLTTSQLNVTLQGVLYEQD